MELLLLGLLSLWTGCASAQEMKPGPGVVNVPEGDDARLPCVHSSGQRVDGFDWRKNNGDYDKITVFEYKDGSRVTGSEFTGRVEYDPEKLASGDASIIITNTGLKDNGTYTCGLGLERTNRQEIQITLNVGAAPKPYIDNAKPFYVTRPWWLLKCTTHGVPQPELKWLNSAGEELKISNPGNLSGRSYVELLLNVTKSDTYTCVATQEKICHQINNTREVNVEEQSTGWTFIAVAVAVTAVVLVLFFGIIIAKHHARFQSMKARAEKAESKLMEHPPHQSDSVTQPLSFHS